MLVGVLKIPGLTIPMHSSIFPQDFPQSYFSTGGLCPPRPPLKLPMLQAMHCMYVIYMHTNQHHTKVS